MTALTTKAMPGNIVSFIIPEITPSNAALLRMHWRKQRRLNKDWHYLVFMGKSAWETVKKATLLPAKTKRKVIVRSYRHNKTDPENVWGGTKPLLDALVTNKLLVDDSPDWLELNIYSEVNRKDKRTEVSICCICADELISF